MRSVLKKVSAAISLMFFVLGMMIVAMSIFWAMDVKLPFKLRPVEGTLISLTVSFVFFLYQKKLYDDDGAPSQALVVTFDRLARVIWNQFTSDPKCIGKIHLVSPYVTIDQTHLNIFIGKQKIQWRQSTAEIMCIDLSTGQGTYISKKQLWRGYHLLVDAFDNIRKVRWD